MRTARHPDAAGRSHDVLVACREMFQFGDAHTRKGLAAVDLPSAYPADGEGWLVEHAVCQAIGVRAKRAGLRGVRAFSARAPEGGGRELAWFPATRGSRARARPILPFEVWYWGS